jgi:phage tail-like protein
MRSAVTGLATAHPLGEQLPAIYAEDPLVQQLTEAFDQVLAPILTTLDCLDSYLDPARTPPDFLPWLASWVAIGFSEHMTLQQRRDLVLEAVSLHRARGTLNGLARLIRTLTGAEAVRITDSGGAAWSTEPGGTLPGTEASKVTIDLPANAVYLNRTWLKAVLDLGVPAHVRVEVDYVGS